MSAIAVCNQCYGIQLSWATKTIWGKRMEFWCKKQKSGSNWTVAKVKCQRVFWFGGYIYNIYSFCVSCMHWMTTLLLQKDIKLEIIELYLSLCLHQELEPLTEYLNKWGFCCSFHSMNNTGTENVPPEQHSVPHSSSFKRVIFQWQNGWFIPTGVNGWMDEREGGGVFRFV